MPFGQQLGPPATHRQLQELLGLLQGAGHSDFREARGPLGFTQRQAGGKFTREEADGFIELLQGEGPVDDTPPPPAVAARLSVAAKALQKLPDEQLAEELHRRGWIVIAP